MCRSGDEDHPRRCGENLLYLNYEDLQVGSPPQVRGKLYNCRCAMGTRRITPAGAGKTQQRLTQRHNQRDHPRRCGENRVTSPMQRGEKGSPPQVRGKLFCVPKRRFCTRITPAGAGKTVKLVILRQHCQDHPRRCGENTVMCSDGKFDMGSPPQVRGKRIAAINPSTTPRITPAGAGKTD